MFVRQISWQNVSSQIPSWSERLGIPWCNSTWMQLLHTPEVQHKNLKVIFSKTQISLQKGVWPWDSRKFLSKGARMLKFYNRHKFESSLHPPYPQPRYYSTLRWGTSLQTLRMWRNLQYHQCAPCRSLVWWPLPDGFWSCSSDPRCKRNIDKGFLARWWLNHPVKQWKPCRVV